MSSNIDFRNRKNYIIHDKNNPMTYPYSESILSTTMQTIAIEVAGANNCNIQVEGCMNNYNTTTKQELVDDECSWTVLATISANDFGVSNDIKKDGIYYVSLSGTRLFRLHTADTASIANAVITFQKIE